MSRNSRVLRSHEHLKVFVAAPVQNPSSYGEAYCVELPRVDLAGVKVRGIVSVLPIVLSCLSCLISSCCQDCCHR
jgi:hypothetical protein